MNHKLILTTWAAALSVSVVTALSTSEANQLQQNNAISASTQAPTQIAQNVTSQESEDPLALPTAPEAPEFDVVKMGESKLAADSEVDKAAIAKIHTHEYKGQPAVTVYVRNIPVATFLGSKNQSNPNLKLAEQQSNDNRAESQDPVQRATTVAATINQLHREGVKADSIRVSWDANRKTYVIKTANTQLLEMSKLTMLPDTTEDAAEDALQITNRLRRQLGNAAPLKTITGRPQPKPQTVAVVAPSSSSGYQFSGEASWYGPGFDGAYTANGERFNKYELTAAHRTLPFGTQVKVTNLHNNRSVIVRINDRGPFTGGRVIDLSQGAAQVIGVINSGVAPVRVDVLK